MGCRTRVFENVNGKKTSIGRGNIANVSINLPRIALENRTIEAFYNQLDIMIMNSFEILMHRMKTMNNNENDYMNYIYKNHIWSDVSNIESMIQMGTFSIGFIGLSETVFILTNNETYLDEKSYNLSIEIIKYMRNKIDKLRTKSHLNISLLASPGEMISGRFCEIDKNIFHDIIQKKGFYTNSFHVPVDSEVSIIKKIEMEAPFHKLCNGGCITYVELGSAPLNNIEALMDIIQFSKSQGISYLGFNYPLDICEECDTKGTFDLCPNCGSEKIKRIRRVSGYLEDLSYFTNGKKCEVLNRKVNKQEEGCE